MTTCLNHSPRSGETTDVSKLRPFVAVTATEWTSLCNSGRLRIAKDRVQKVRPGAPPESYGAVFAAAPVTHLSDDKDLLVLQLASDWASEAEAHPDLSKKIVYLPLETVEHHQALTTPAYDYHHPLGQKVGVEISQETLEDPWLFWVEAELGRSRLQAAKELLRHFGLSSDLSEPRPDGLTWEQLISLVVRPRPTGLKPTPHLETLMLNLRHIVDNIAETRGMARYHLAALIEWIEAVLEIDILEDQEVASLYEETRLAIGEVVWDDPASGPSLSVFQRMLHQRYFSGFSEELDAETVSWAIRFISETKSEMMNPSTFSEKLSQFVSENHVVFARLLVVAIASLLGPARSRILRLAVASPTP